MMDKPDFTRSELYMLLFCVRHEYRLTARRIRRNGNNSSETMTMTQLSSIIGKLNQWRDVDQLKRAE